MDMLHRYDKSKQMDIGNTMLILQKRSPCQCNNPNPQPNKDYTIVNYLITFS